jgi:hypothetical protein
MLSAAMKSVLMLSVVAFSLMSLFSMLECYNKHSSVLNKDIRQNATTLSLKTLCIMTLHNDTLHNDTLHNDTLHNDTLHNDTLHNDTLHNDNQHNRIRLLW